jgi:hypothetical protein
LDPFFGDYIRPRFHSTEPIHAQVAHGRKKNCGQFRSRKAMEKRLLPLGLSMLGDQSTKRFLYDVFAIGFIRQQATRVPSSPAPKFVEFRRVKGRGDWIGCFGLVGFQSRAFRIR